MTSDTVRNAVMYLRVALDRPRDAPDLCVVDSDALRAVVEAAEQRLRTETLVEQSSLGTAAARAARASVPDHVAERVVADSRSHRITTLFLPDSVKMIGEAMNVAASAIVHTYGDGAGGVSDYGRRYLRVIEAIGHEVSRQRPTGSDGKHGNAHTESCGCDWEHDGAERRPAAIAEFLRHAGADAIRAAAEYLPTSPPPPTGATPWLYDFARLWRRGEAIR